MVELAAYSLQCKCRSAGYTPFSFPAPLGILSLAYEWLWGQKNFLKYGWLDLENEILKWLYIKKKTFKNYLEICVSKAHGYVFRAPHLEKHAAPKETRRT